MPTRVRDSSIFAMIIEDSALYSNYLSKYSYDSIKGSYRSYDITKPLGLAFFDAYNKLLSSQNPGGALNDDDAFAQAQAFVLSKFNSGLVIYRKRKGETKFSKLNTKVNYDQNGNPTYTSFNCL